MTRRTTVRVVAGLCASLFATALLAVSAGSPASADPPSAWQTYKNSMNGAEKSWCRWPPSRWGNCLTAYGPDGARWAIPRAAECQAPRCENGDEQNALQHCLWSASLKLRLGEDKAMGFLTRHEANSDNDADSQRDWENNHKGFEVARQVAADDAGVSMKSAILNRCWALADGDQLTYIR